MPRWLKADYIGKRRIWFAISAAVMAISIGALAVNGLNLGIDFKGGTQITFSTPDPVPVEDVRAEAAGLGQGDAVIQGRGASENGEYTEFQIRTESLTQQEIASLQSSLEGELDATAFGAKNVSESFGRQIASSAILAIIVSLLLIVGYISLRFQWKFAAPVLVALAHDLVITIGIYALVGREMSTATVAAVLTVLGYSIYDTIIIFDRIRENMPLMKRAVVPGDRERVALGDDPPVAGHDVHHAAPDRVAVRLRRRDAEGLRVRAADRHRLGRVLLDLHRRTAARVVQGARAGVRAAQ